MKKVSLILLLLSIVLATHAQEMESLIFNLSDMHLNIRPDSSNGSSQLNLSRFGDYRQAQVNFQYWYEDYTFGPGPYTGGNAQWNLGVNSGEFTEGDFSIDNKRLSFDLLVLRRDFTIREDNGYVGIGMYDRPDARFHVDHLSTEENAPTPALQVGLARPTKSYMTIHKPKFDTNTGIAQFADNGYSTVYINGPSSSHQVQVNGQICANSYYTFPIIVIGFGKLKSAGSILDKLKVQSNLKARNSTEEGVGINLESLRSLAPSLVANTESIQDDGTIVTEDVVNYTGLIPILVKGHQEQTKELNDAKTEIALLKETITKLESLVMSKL